MGLEKVLLLDAGDWSQPFVTSLFLFILTISPLDIILFICSFSYSFEFVFPKTVTTLLVSINT
ncbi:MAG: hypothetical protein RR848_06030, partial [Oscillospiraceae bacterium]